MDLETVMANRDIIKAWPAEKQNLFLSLAFDHFVSPKLKLSDKDTSVAKQKWIDCFVGRPSAPFPSNFARPSEKTTQPPFLGGLMSPGLLPALRVTEIFVVSGLVIYLLVRGIKGFLRVGRGSEWFSRRDGRGVAMKRTVDFALQSVAWAAVLAGMSYLVHPKFDSRIEYSLGLEIPWLPDVCWFALPFGIGMTYLIYRFRVGQGRHG